MDIINKRNHSLRNIFFKNKGQLLELDNLEEKKRGPHRYSTRD